MGVSCDECIFTACWRGISVISPDPFLQTNEIGIPLYFARNLTFAEPVTQLNFHRLRQAVENGPNTWPGTNYWNKSHDVIICDVYCLGANAIEDENGIITRLNLMDEDKRKAQAKLLVTPFTSGMRMRLCLCLYYVHHIDRLIWVFGYFIVYLFIICDFIPQGRDNTV